MPIGEIMAMCDAINEIGEERKRILNESNHDE